MADTPDQRPDDTTNADLDRSELPPDLLPLHERLIADGARWRRRAPDGHDLPAWARATLLAVPPSLGGASAPNLRERRLDAPDERLSQPKGPRVPMESPNDRRQARWRALAGGLAAAAVVGLLATLLVHSAAQRGAGASTSGTPSATSKIAGTPTPPDTSGTNPANFVQPAQLPVVAPSDTRIAYRVNTNNQVQRSTDGGKHFTPMTQPSTGLSDIGFTGLAVSPLSADTVFFNAAGQKAGQGCPPAQSYGALTLTQHGGILASGYVPCTAQFFSSDGGRTWRALTLPTGGVLGGTMGFLTVQYYQNAQQYTIQAQGRRLYSAVAFANGGGSLIDSPGVRLVASDDGGATWKLLDSALVRDGNTIVCDFAAAPTGTTIYATTSPGSCGSESAPSISLWRSDNGGQSWLGPIRDLPTIAETGMVVSNSGWLYTYTPDVTVQGHGMSATSTPASAIVSKDGGKTFSPAPIAGLSAKDGLAGPFATLSDGSVVYALQGGNPDTGTTDTLYSWKPGASAWTQLTGVIAGGANAVIVTPISAGGDTLTIITDAGGIISLTTPN